MDAEADAAGAVASVAATTAKTARKIVNQRALGVAAGDFFQRYGPPRSRDEALDGTLNFDWEGGSVSMPAGPVGIEDKICRLKITADKSGRIVAAPIVRDAKGVRRLSRCEELFDIAG